LRASLQFISKLLFENIEISYKNKGDSDGEIGWSKVGHRVQNRQASSPPAYARLVKIR